MQVLGCAGGRFRLQGGGGDQVAPALVGVAVAARVEGQGERRLLLGSFGAGVEVVDVLGMRVRQAQRRGR